MRLPLLVCALALGFMLPASPSMAAEQIAPEAPTVQGQAHTLYRFWQGRTALDQIHTWHPLQQGFSFRIAEPGPRPKAAFETAFSVGGDFYDNSGEVRVRSAWVDLSPFGRPLTLRLGRQARTQGTGGLGFLRFDGASLKVRSPTYLSMEAFIGVLLDTVQHTWGPSAGEGEESPADTGPQYGDRWTGGVELYLEGLARAQFRAGVQTRSTGGSVDRADFHLDFSHALGEPLLFRYGMRANLLMRRLDFLLGAVEVHPVRQLSIVTEVEHYKPSFDASSMFNVFALDPYWEVRVRAAARPLPMLSVWGGVGAQIYPSAEDLQGEPIEGVQNTSLAWNLGARVRLGRAGRVGAQVRHSTGWLGEKLLASLDGGLNLGPVTLDLSAGLQRYAFDLQPNLAALSFIGSARARVRISNWISAHALGVVTADPFLQRNLRVTAGIDVLLGARTVPRKNRSELAWLPALSAVAARRPVGGAGGFGVNGGYR